MYTLGKKNKLTRQYIRGKYNIVPSIYKTKKCSKCFYHNRSRVCGKHYIKTSLEDVCPYYIKSSNAVYSGGGVSPR